MTNTVYENPVSHKMQELSKIGSEIRNTFMLGQKLRVSQKNMIDLSLGNPDLEPPDIVKHKIYELLQSKDEGAHRYMDAAGLLDVREFLASALTKSENVPITQNNVYMTVGAAGALQICMRTFLDMGDEVIIFTPYFPEYIAYANHLHAKPIVVQSDENHIPIFAELEQKISSKTKLVILNSPNNPSGVYYSAECLKKIFFILQASCKRLGRMIPVISDEPYVRLLYVPQTESALKMYPYTFLVRSLSKDLGLAGERIGYLVWRDDVFSHTNESMNVMNIFRNAARVSGFVSAPRLMQRLIPHIYHAKVNVNIYKERVDCFLEQLKRNEIVCTRPSAGFFVFPKIKNTHDDVSFCTMLAQQGLLCVPGSAFGKPGYVRASLTQDISQIEAAGILFAKFC